MADAYQLETTADRYLLEDGSGVYLLEVSAAADPVILVMAPYVPQPMGDGF